MPAAADHDHTPTPPVSRRPRRQLPAPEAPARRARAQGPGRDLARAELRAVEDDAIAEIVKFQEDVGLKSVTDGEFRRTYFHIDFLEQLGGVKTDIPVTIRKPDGSEELAPPVMRVIDKVRHVKDIQKADFEFLKSKVTRRPHAEGDDPFADHAALSRRPRRHQPRALPRPRAVLPGRRQRLRRRAALAAAAGATYVQMDDTNLAYLCDDKMREAARSRGDDPDELPHRYASVHQPRRGAEARRHDARACTCAAATSRAPGRRRAATSRWPRRCSTRWASTATSSSTTTRAPATSSRCASCPRARRSCSAWSPPSSARSNRKTTLKRRIDEAAKYVPLEQLCLSPQCGFSSTVHGNDIAVEAQRAKLRLIVEVADEVWGGH